MLQARIGPRGWEAMPSGPRVQFGSVGLICLGEAALGRPWRRRIAFGQVAVGEGAAVNGETFQPARALGQRLAKYQRTAFVGAAPVAGSDLVPNDIAANELGFRDRSRRLAG